jgi:hypothetical protein
MLHADASNAPSKSVNFSNKILSFVQARNNIADPDSIAYVLWEGCHLPFSRLLCDALVKSGA